MANLHREVARGDRKNKLGAGTPCGEGPRNLNVPDSSLESLLASGFLPGETVGDCSRKELTHGSRPPAAPRPPFPVMERVGLASFSPCLDLY